MGAAIASSVTLGLTYCCCNAAGSLCNACLGSTAAGTTGRKRSVLLLALAVAVALWWQYNVGPNLVQNTGLVYKTLTWIPTLAGRTSRAWQQGCHDFSDSATEEERFFLTSQCAGMAGVYRPMAVTAFFFTVQAIATKVQPSLNREAWPAKYGLFGFLVVVSLFLPNGPLFTGIFLWLARLGATLFVLLQQVILVDVAYNWNEDWVDRADQADRVDYGSGQTWLQGIVAVCAGFYLTALTGIIVLYQYFDGCPGNVWIITLTLLAIVGLTAVQLSGSEGSLLTSSVLSVYSVYLAYCMVSKNPNGECNPLLGSNDVWGMAIGLTLTAVSLAWTGWSWTAEERLNLDGVQSAKAVSGRPAIGEGEGVNLEVPFLDPNAQPATGMVLEQGDGPASVARPGDEGLWKLNVVMALISCWVAMTLTGWGTMEMTADMANPTVGRVNMAMLGISQWMAIFLYLWTLVAPRLFPDREFA